VPVFQAPRVRLRSLSLARDEVRVILALPPYRHAAGMSVIALMTTHRRQQLAAAGVCAESLAAVKVRVVSQVGRLPGSLELSVTEMSDHESA
jgi:hypothetical protein